MINNRLEPTCIRTLLRSSCCCAVVPEQDLHTESVHPPLVVDHPVVDVHLAEVAEVPFSAEPLPGLRHAGQTEVATREEILVRPAVTVESGTEQQGTTTTVTVSWKYVTC